MTASVNPDDLERAARRAATSLWEKVQYQIGKDIFSIVVSPLPDGGHTLCVYGTKLGMRDLPFTWEGFPLLKRESGPFRML
jgi:hypothetical protein